MGPGDVRNAHVLTISFLALLVVVAGAVGAVSIFGSGSDEQPTVTPTSGGVYVFFLREDAEPYDKSAYVPSERPAGDDTSAQGRLRSALSELVGGPTPKERSGGLTSVFSESTAGLVNKVEVVDGHAVVDFRDFTQQIPQVSTSTGGITFMFQLNLTVFQFDEIQQVDYLMEGDCSRFWQFLQAECQTITREAWDEAEIDVEP